MTALAPIVRLLRAAAGAIAAVLVLGILLVVLEANQDNGLVDFVLDVGRFFADPFRAIFDLEDAKAQIAVNWGIAAVAYLAAAAAVAALLRAAAARAPRRRRG